MVKDIAEIVSTQTYDGQLVSAPSTQVGNRPTAGRFREFAKQHMKLETNCLLIDLPSGPGNVTTMNNSGSKGNDFFVSVVADVVEKLLASFGATATIAILTPYRFQEEKYKIMLGAMREKKLANYDKINVSSITCTQGQQFDIVIMDLPINNSVGFLSDERMLNVAVSRAMNGLIVVCDRKVVDNVVRKSFWSPSKPARYLEGLVHKLAGRTWTRPQISNLPDNIYYPLKKNEGNTPIKASTLVGSISAPAMVSGRQSAHVKETVQDSSACVKAVTESTPLAARAKESEVVIKVVQATQDLNLGKVNKFLVLN